MHDDFYQMYLEEMETIDPCTEEEEKSLLSAAAAGDAAAKERLVEGNLMTALTYAREFDGQGVLLTDLVQEANMGLVMAVEEYAGGIRQDFKEFAGERIRQALERAVEEEKASDTTGEELAARVNVLQEVSKVMAAQLGREATVEELAGKMKMTEDEVRQIMKMAMDAISVNTANMDLDALTDGDGPDMTEMTGDEADYESVLEEGYGAGGADE